MEVQNTPDVNVVDSDQIVVYLMKLHYESSTKIWAGQEEGSILSLYTCVYNNVKRVHGEATITTVRFHTEELVQILSSRSLVLKSSGSTIRIAAAAALELLNNQVTFLSSFW